MKFTMTMTMDLQPFQAPNFVRVVAKTGLKQDGMVETQCIPLSNLDSATLENLCNQFRDEVFKKAGLKAPEVE